MADNTTTNWEDFTPGPGDKPLSSISPSAKQDDSWGDGDKPAPASLLRKAGDLGLSVAKGVIAVPEAAVGLADIATGGEAGKFLENDGGAFGFRPKQAKEYLSSLQSDDLQGKQREFQQADGVIDKTKAALSNPSLITNAVAESVPLMGAGAVPARAALAVAPKVGALAAGAIGEGVAGAGSAAEQVRQETTDGLLTPEQAGLAAASGAATAAFGMAGGKLAQRLGIGDVDTMLAQGAAKTAGAPSAKSIPRQVVEGAIAEGWLEELPQSVSEQILQNLSLNKPWSEGVEDAAVMGTLAGMAMGGAAAGVSGFNERGDKPADQALPPAQPPAPIQGTGPKLALPAPERGVIQVGGDGTARTPAYQAPGYVGDVTDVQPRPIDPVREQVAAAAEQGGALSGAALTAIDTGVTQAMQPVVPEVAPPSPISLEEADARDQAAYEQFFANHDSDPVVSRYFEDDTDIPDFGAASNVSDEEFLRSLGATDEDIQDAIATASQPSIPQSRPAVNAGAQANEPAGPREGAGGNQSAPGQIATPTNLRDGLAKIRAQKQQEAANAQAATPEATPATTTVSAARPGAVEAAGVERSKLLAGLDQTGATREMVLDAQLKDAQYRLAQITATTGILPADRASRLSAINQEIADLNAVRDQARALDERDRREGNTRSMLQGARQELDAAVRAGAVTPEAAQAIASNAKNTGNTADAADAVFTAVDSAVAAGPAADVKAITAKQIPDMTDAELQVAIAHYGPAHKRTAKLQKEVQRRAAQATQGSTNATQTAQAQQASPQPAQAGPAPAAEPATESAPAPASAGASTVRALNDGAPAENPGAQATPAPGAQAAAADETREQRTQRVAAAGEAWTRMRAVEREALAARAEGLNPIQRKRVPSAAWADLNSTIQRKLADAMGGRAETGGDKTAAPTAEGPISNPTFTPEITQQAQAATENVASNSAGQDEKARWLKSVADMNRMSGQSGAQIDGVTNGRLSVVGNPNATKQGRALMAAVDEARRAGATNEEIAAAAIGASANSAPVATNTVAQEGNAEPRKGEIGGKYAAGEVLITSSGRKTAPFPRVDASTNGKANNTILRVNRWLIGEALAEAQSRGDDFNERQFQAINNLNPSQSDKDSAEEYLFGEQPAVVPSILKPLVGANESAAAPAPPPGVVNVPPAIAAALDADMQAQKARITRLRNSTTADGMSLDEKKQAQTQLKGAEFTLQIMRRTRFDAEDAALKAIEQNDMAPFAEHITFFKTEKVLQELIVAAQAPAPAATAAKPAPKKKPSADQTRAKADLMAALADLGDILGKNTRMNITPEQEQKLLPVLTRVLDAAFRLGYAKFKDSAKFALDQIRANLGNDAADALTLDHLQGAYIAMAGGKEGVDTKRAVIEVESKAEIEAHEAVTVEDDQGAAETERTLTQTLRDELAANRMPKDNPALKKLVEAFDGKPADQARMKQAQEALEAAIVQEARARVEKLDKEGAKTTFASLLRLYESQPLLNVRTSTSIANQAYSTPAPLAYLASKLAGINQQTLVHEPTGGTGMLLIGADPKNAVVNELNDLRVSLLKEQGFNPTQKDAAIGPLRDSRGQVDAVITNPPFGSVKGEDGKPIKVKVDGYNIGQIDHLIAAHALATMKDDGRAVLIIGANKAPGGLSTDDRIFFNWLYSHYNVAGHFEVEGDLYARQGAGWPVRVIAINGREKSAKLSPVAGTIQRADNWDQVYEQFTQILGSGRRPVRGAGDAAGRASDSQARPAGVPGNAGAEAAGSGGRVATAGADSAGNVAGAGAGTVADRTGATTDPVGHIPDEQRLNGQSFVPPGLVETRPGADVPANRPAKPSGTTAVAAAPAAAGNEFQTPYVPRSARKDEGVLIPSNMAQPTQDALNRLEDAVGDIDEFARKELGYESTEALHKALMGLQVDSVATAIYQIKQGKAAVIADQTGIGKGRQAASIIRWAARNGMTPVFVSVKPSLFTDMYGDLADIGTHDVAPFILNSTEWVSGADGEKLFTNKPSTHRSAIQSIVDDAALPQGRNALFMTYSQINTANLQRQALMALAPNAVFVLDESHNAAGDSGTGDFMISVLKEARGVTYLSATYAKRPDNMPLYFKTDIGDAAADSEGLADAMASGGLPLQTVVSNNLVKAGQMFRRERSYDGVSIASTFDTANRQLHERLSDEATEALRAIVSADKMFHSVFVKSMDKALKAEGSKVQDNAGNQVSAGVQHTEFSSVVHNFVRQMLLGLKAQTAADEAIASLKRGEKPIIAVENTMGSFLSEYAAQNNINQGDSLGAFDYRTVLSRALERSRVINVVLPTGDKSKQNIRLSQLDPITRKAYDQAQEVIDRLAIDIPVSPIDWMRAEIARAGFSVAEITGRDLSVDYSNPRKPVLSAIDLTEQRDKVASTRRFNGGELDALILNVAGSTGISLHASEKFADQRQRHMIVAQAAGDINIFMQMLGRVHRTGQVRLPKYTILSVDLPTEKRPTAVLSRKMKSLNANTSSNTESATSVKTADILNKYGDQIVNQYLVDNLELARQLGVDDLLSSDGERVSDDIARKATGRLALQPIEVQRAFYEDVEAQYDALIEYLNKTNQNDLEPRTFDFDAKEVRTEILFDGPNKATPFGEDAVYGEYSIKAQGVAMKPEEIQEAIAESLQGKTGAEHARDLLNGLLQTYVEQTNAALAQKVGQGAAFDLDEYAAFLKPLFGEDGAARMMAQAQAFMANGTPVGQLTVRDLSGAQGVEAGMEFLRNHAIGKTFRVEINSEPYNAVITNVRNTHKTTGNPFSLSKFQITLAVNGALRSITVPATQFKKIEVSSIAPAFRIETLFKEQPANQRETAKIVTGNLLAAYGEIKGARGTIISFTKADGVIEQGILLPKLFDFSKNTQGDYRLRSGADALKFLQQSTNKDIGRFGIATRDGQVRVLPRGDGVQVRVPKSKAQGARYFLDKNLIAVAGDFVSSANAMVANVDDAASAAKVLDLLMDKQALYALPSMADEAKSMAAKKDAGSGKADGPEAIYSSADSTPPAKPLSLDRVNQLVQEALSGIRGSPPVEVTARPADIGLKVPAGSVGYGVTLRSGDIYVFQSAMGSDLDVFKTVFHELFHRGVRVLVPKAQYVQAMLDLAKGDSRIQQLAIEWKNTEMGQKQKDNLRQQGYTGAELTGQYEALAIEEALAAVAEEIKAEGRLGSKPKSMTIRFLANWLAKLADLAGMKKLAQGIRTMTYNEAERFVMSAISRSGEPVLTGRTDNMSAKEVDSNAGIRFRSADLGSRAGMADLTGKARDELNKTFGAPGKLSWWHKTVGTMFNLAERSPDFKRVFDSAQGFVDDVSYYATDAAELAPRLLPKLETWRDIAKRPITAADNAAVAKPVFEGTLDWARDESGKPVRLQTLLDQAAKLTPEQKAQRLLRNDKISAGMLKAWQGLPLDQYEKLVASRYESQMLKAGVVWTPAELKSLFKLTDAQVELYQEFRAATDRSLDTMARADMLRYGGKDVAELRDMVMDAKDAQDAAQILRNHLQMLAKENPDRAGEISQLSNGMLDRAARVQELQEQGYAPLSRFGQYTVDVVDANGERQYFGLFETAREANVMAIKMRKEFGQDAVTQGTLSNDEFKLLAGITPESLELFGNMLGLESDGDQARDQAFQEYLRRTKTNRSAMRRLIHRQGIAGYSEDVGRVLASFIYSNSRQTSAGLHMGELGEAITAIPKQQGELKDAAIQLSEYVKNPQEEAQAVRGLLFAQYLGGSIASAFVNMSQPAAVTFPWLSQFGGAKQAAAELGRAAKNLANRGHRYEADLATALKQAEEEGTVSPQEVHQLMAQARGSGSLRPGDGTRAGDARAAAGNALTRLSLAWGKVFGAAEQVNRRMTFIAAYRVAKAQGMANPAAFAKKAVIETQFTYSKANKMKWGRGAVGATAMTFKTYSIAYLELLGRMWTQGEPGSQERKDGRKAVLLALGMLMLMGGAGGLPFAEDAEDLVDGLAQLAGYNFNSKKAKQELLESLFGEAGAGFIERGITGLPGMPLDVSGRLGMGNLLPATGLFKEKTDYTRDVLEVVGPVGDLAKRVASGARSILAGDVGAGLLQMAPAAARNWAKGADMAVTGMYRDDKGYKVLDTSPAEAAMKFIGFQPASVSKVQEANFINQQAKNFYNMQAQEIRAKWAKGIFEKDTALVAEARADLEDWNRKNPDQRIVVSMPAVLKRVREMGKSKDQRIADTAPKAMRQQLREEAAKARATL